MKIKKNEIEENVLNLSCRFTPCCVVLLFIQEPCDNFIFIWDLDLFIWLFQIAPRTPLQESECKAYNPRPFCKTYTMDKQPLNTGEQKDMTEFFTDLITKIEEMSPELVSSRILKFLWNLYRFAHFYSLFFVVVVFCFFFFKEKYRQKFVWRCNYKQCCVLGKYSTCSLFFWGWNS